MRYWYIAAGILGQVSRLFVYSVEINRDKAKTFPFFLFWHIRGIWRGLFLASDVVLESVTYGGVISVGCHGAGQTQARRSRFHHSFSAAASFPSPMT